MTEREALSQDTPLRRKTMHATCREVPPTGSGGRVCSPNHLGQGKQQGCRRGGAEKIPAPAGLGEEHIPRQSLPLTVSVGGNAGVWRTSEASAPFPPHRDKCPPSTVSCWTSRFTPYPGSFFPLPRTGWGPEFPSPPRDRWDVWFLRVCGGQGR